MSTGSARKAKVTRPTVTIPHQLTAKVASFLGGPTPLTLTPDARDCRSEAAPVICRRRCQPSTARWFPRWTAVVSPRPWSSTKSPSPPRRPARAPHATPTRPPSPTAGRRARQPAGTTMAASNPPLPGGRGAHTSARSVPPRVVIRPLRLACAMITGAIRKTRAATHRNANHNRFIAQGAPLWESAIPRAPTPEDMGKGNAGGSGPCYGAEGHPHRSSS